MFIVGVVLHHVSFKSSSIKKGHSLYNARCRNLGLIICLPVQCFTTLTGRSASLLPAEVFLASPLVSLPCAFLFHGIFHESSNTQVLPANMGLF